MRIDFGVNVPFIQHFGITLEKFDGGEAELVNGQVLMCTAGLADR